MHDNKSLARLIAELRNLDDRDPRTLSKDLRTSLTCWRIEQRLRAGLPVDNESYRRLTAWVRTLIEVGSYLGTHGGLPRENNRHPQDTEEARLAFWLRYQRRRAIARDLCSYQQASLSCLDGFSWAPIDDAWDSKFEAYKRFLEREQRSPRYRSTAPGEQKLAAWAAKQRYAFKRGRLEEARADRLDTLSIRILPSRRKRQPN